MRLTGLLVLLAWVCTGIVDLDAGCIHGSRLVVDELLPHGEGETNCNCQDVIFALDRGVYVVSACGHLNDWCGRKPMWLPGLDM